MNELRVGKAAKIGDVTLIPLFNVQVTSIQQPDLLWLNGTAEPFAVVIIEPEGLRVVGVDERELVLETLVEKIPNLDATIQYWMADP